MKRLDRKKSLFLVMLMMLALFPGLYILPQSVNAQKKSIKGSILERQKEDLKFFLNTLPGDCKLCGDGEDTWMYWYGSQDNLGIISVNTFAISYIEINPYDAQGGLIEETNSGLGTHIQSTGENGFVSVVTVNSNRRYASGNIHMNLDKSIDMKKASENLCAECLNRVLDTVWMEPYGVGLINFKTGELRLFEEGISGFMLGDFYVLCDPRAGTDSEEVSDIKLHIFYCPER